MGYFLPTLLHFLVGVCICYLLFNREFRSKKMRLIIFLLGGACAIAPDVTKYFGDQIGHSILAVPLFGLLFAAVFRIIIKEFSLLKTWLIFSITVLIGQILIDYLGNGAAFLYPFIKREIDFHIIDSIDYIIIITLLITVLIGFFLKKGKAIILTGTIIICSYLAVLAISKFQLEYSLKSEYDENKIELLQTYPSERHGFAMWDFHVRTKEIWVNGYSPMFNTELHIESERKVDFN